jgi:phenylacetate-coenzyme A ligase PaaK-like adenylate-forming protein
MSDAQQQDVETVLSRQPFGASEEERASTLLPLLTEQVEASAAACGPYRNVVRHWPVHPREAKSIAELPFLPVEVFKRTEPLATVPPDEFQRVIASSSTTGQTPSLIAVDRTTAWRMSRTTSAIIGDFIGKQRRPILVADVPRANPAAINVGARDAAARGLMPFATESVHCLEPTNDGTLIVDVDRLLAFFDRHAGESVLVYGLTTLLWFNFVQPLKDAGITLDHADVHVLHSGGWKRLADRSVDKTAFSAGVASTFGTSSDRVIDFYGLVENLGIVYPDCSEGHKHAPMYGQVIVRDPVTTEPVTEGGKGFLQLCSIIPNSFPGHLLLTEDMASVPMYDGCPCGRPGIAFRFESRVPKAEVRGCGNIRPRGDGE